MENLRKDVNEARETSKERGERPETSKILREILVEILTGMTYKSILTVNSAIRKA